MIIIKMNSDFRLECKHAWTFGDKAYPSDMFVIRLLVIDFYFTKSSGSFTRYLNRFINNDFSFHRLVRLEAKKAVSKARASEKKYSATNIKRLQMQIDDHRNKRQAIEAELRVAERTIEGLKLALRVVQK